jgi:hypothetical protein
MGEDKDFPIPLPEVVEKGAVGAKLHCLLSQTLSEFNAWYFL